MISRRDAETQRRRDRIKRVRPKYSESELCVSASLREYFVMELGLNQASRDLYGKKGRQVTPIDRPQSHFLASFAFYACEPASLPVPGRLVEESTLAGPFVARKVEIASASYAGKWTFGGMNVRVCW
jgi:hypothetical protein